MNEKATPPAARRGSQTANPTGTDAPPPLEGGPIVSVSERTMNGLAILFPGIPAEQLLDNVEKLFDTNREFSRAAARYEDRDCPQVTLVGQGVLRMPTGQRVLIGHVQCYEPRGADTIAFRVDGHEQLVALESGAGVASEKRDALMEKLDELFGPVKTV